jgi:hypothetical protein
MNSKQKKRFLCKSGFAFLRQARHGAIYADQEGNRIMLARPGTKDTRAEKNFVSQIERLIRSRCRTPGGDVPSNPK